MARRVKTTWKKEWQTHIIGTAAVLGDSLSNGLPLLSVVLVSDIALGLEKKMLVFVLDVEELALEADVAVWQSAVSMGDAGDLCVTFLNGRPGFTSLCGKMWSVKAVKRGDVVDLLPSSRRGPCRLHHIRQMSEAGLCCQQ